MMPLIHLLMLYAYATNVDRLLLVILDTYLHKTYVLFSRTEFQYAQQEEAK